MSTSNLVLTPESSPRGLIASTCRTVLDVISRRASGYRKFEDALNAFIASGDGGAYTKSCNELTLVFQKLSDQVNSCEAALKAANELAWAGKLRQIQLLEQLKWTSTIQLHMLKLGILKGAEQRKCQHAGHGDPSHECDDESEEPEQSQTTQAREAEEKSNSPTNAESKPSDPNQGDDNEAPVKFSRNYPTDQAKDSIGKQLQSALDTVDSMRFNNETYIRDSHILRQRVAQVAERLGEIMEEMLEFLEDPSEE